MKRWAAWSAAFAPKPKWPTSQASRARARRASTYNVNPQLPDTAYGQFVVNTKSEKTTPALVAGLRESMARVAPEALVIVKELQQGMPVEAPVEVRISGYDIATLEQLASGRGHHREAPGAEMVFTTTISTTLTGWMWT